MNYEEFDQFLEETFESTRKVLASKGEEYAGDSSSRFHNFEIAAALNRELPEEALWGFVTKHIVSLSDMVVIPEHATLAAWDEKIGDVINYMILLKGMVRRHDANKRKIETDAAQDAAEGRMSSLTMPGEPTRVYNTYNDAGERTGRSTVVHHTPGANHPRPVPDPR